MSKIDTKSVRNKAVDMMNDLKGIAGKFLGNRQALLALTEVAKDANKDVFKRMVFNTETEAEKLQSRIIELEINFPKSILMVPVIRIS